MHATCRRQPGIYSNITTASQRDGLSQLKAILDSKWRTQRSCPHRPLLGLTSTAGPRAATARWRGKCSTRLLGAASLSQTLNSGLLFLLAKLCSLQTFLKPWLDLPIAIVSVDPFNKIIPYINTYGCVYFSSILNLPIGNITFICVSMWNWQGSCPFGSPASMFCRITAYREGRDPENSCWPQGKSEALKPFRQLIHLNCFLETSQLPQMILSVLRKFY